MFESFRVGNVPVCRKSQTLEDIFNMDDDLGTTGLLLDPEEAEDLINEEPKPEETLF